LGPLFKGERGRAGAGLCPESYLQPNQRFVQVLLRIRFDFFDYASVLFLCPEVFNEHEMRPGRHGHKVRATGCPGGTTQAVGSGGSVMDSTRRGGKHGQRWPWPGSTMLRQWQRPLVGFGTELGSGRFSRVGRAGVTVDFGPLPYKN
jgi:hypothetical protein